MCRFLLSLFVLAPVLLAEPLRPRSAPIVPAAHAGEGAVGPEVRRALIAVQDDGGWAQQVVAGVEAGQLNLSIETDSYSAGHALLWTWDGTAGTVVEELEVEAAGVPLWQALTPLYVPSTATSSFPPRGCTPGDVFLVTLVQPSFQEVENNTPLPEDVIARAHVEARRNTLFEQILFPVLSRVVGGETAKKVLFHDNCLSQGTQAVLSATAGMGTDVSSSTFFSELAGAALDLDLITYCAVEGATALKLDPQALLRNEQVLAARDGLRKAISVLNVTEAMRDSEEVAGLIDEMDGRRSPLTWSVTCAGDGPIVGVYPVQAPVGELFSEPGAGFTPGGEVELFFRYPDGHVASTTRPAQEDGTFMHFYRAESTEEMAPGKYEYWGVDLTTGAGSAPVSFTVMPP